MRFLRRATRALRTPASQRGYTLIEMMIATSLLSLVVASAFSVVIVMQNEAVRTTDRFTAESEGQTIADRITKDLRTAVAPSSTTAAFASADTNDVVFYASLANLNTGNGPTRLHAFVSLVPATNVYVFHEDSTAPDSTSTPGNYTYNGTPATRLDGQYLDTSQPIFSYYDSHFPTPNKIPTPIAVTSDLRSIDQVCINLRVRVHPASPIVVVSTCIHVRNVDYNPNT